MGSDKNYLDSIQDDNSHDAYGGLDDNSLNDGSPKSFVSQMLHMQVKRRTWRLQGRLHPTASFQCLQPRGVAVEARAGEPLLLGLVLQADRRGHLGQLQHSRGERLHAEEAE